MKLRLKAVILPCAVIALSSGPSAQAQLASAKIRTCPDLADYYPQRALRQGIEGKADYAIKLDPRGAVAEITLTSSAGDDGLDAAGAKFLRACRFDSSSARGNSQATFSKSVIFRVPRD